MFPEAGRSQIWAQPSFVQRNTISPPSIMMVTSTSVVATDIRCDERHRAEPPMIDNVSALRARRETTLYYLPFRRSDRADQRPEVGSPSESAVGDR